MDVTYAPVFLEEEPLLAVLITAAKMTFVSDLKTRSIDGVHFLFTLYRLRERSV